MKKIAILGATGYIGRSLVMQFVVEKTKEELHLFSRSKAALENMFSDVPKKGMFEMHDLTLFEKGKYDVIINCTGIVDSLILKKHPALIFKVTEDMDELILDYLSKKPKTLCINMSSGAVYGNNSKDAINDATQSVFSMKDIGPNECYAIAKLHSEAKHRAHAHLHIVDLRVFAFFSSLVDVESGFLMSEITRSLRDKKIFVTTSEDIMRDYSTPKDLLALIRLVMKHGKINDAFDVYSKKPVSKFELLQFFVKHHGLIYEVRDVKKGKTSGLSKKSYFSKSRKAGKVLGYVPSFTTLSGIEVEIDKMNL